MQRPSSGSQTSWNEAGHWEALCVAWYLETFTWSTGDFWWSPWWFTVSRHAQVNRTTGARILSQGFGFLNEQLTKQMRMLQSEYLSRYFNIMRKHDSQTWSLQNLHRLLPSPDETTPPGVWLARESPKSWSLPWGFTGAVCTEGILWWNLFVRHTVT